VLFIRSAATTNPDANNNQRSLGNSFQTGDQFPQCHLLLRQRETL
jgi:hypothetical protein